MGGHRALSLLNIKMRKESGVLNKRWHARARVALAIATVLALPTSSFAQVKVIISGGFSAAYREILPEFERTSGVTVTTTSKSAPLDCIFDTISSGVSNTVYSTSTPYRSPNPLRTFFQM